MNPDHSPLTTHHEQLTTDHSPLPMSFDPRTLADPVFFSRLDNLELRARACLGFCLSKLDRREEAEAHLAAARGGVRSDDPISELELCSVTGWVRLGYDQLDLARAELERGLELARLLRNKRFELYFVWKLGSLHESVGRLEEAARCYAEACATRDPVYRATGLGYAGRLRLRRGEIEAQEMSATGALAEVIALAPLANLFTYANEVRSLSQGRAAAAIEPHSYRPAPPEVLRGLLGE